MLLNNGRHPTTNVTVVPEDVLALVSRGRTVGRGVSDFPEVVRPLVSNDVDLAHLYANYRA